MARDIDPTDRHEPRSDRDRPSDTPRPIAEKPAPSREPVVRNGRNYAYSLSESELETMRDVGRFRTVALQDLSAVRYRGQAYAMRQDLQSLADQGLIERRTLWTGAKSGRLAVVVLTRRGKEALEREGGPRGTQEFYAGFVKPAEVAHDAAIYPMYQAESARIIQAGGRIRRVVLDYELKRKVYSPLAKARASSPGTYARRQMEVARENGLRVIRSKIVLPDLRVEYETSSGEAARVDLELATHHYHGSHLAAKAEAGFRMYAPDGAAGHLRAVLEEREITAEIFSL